MRKLTRWLEVWRMGGSVSAVPQCHVFAYCSEALTRFAKFHWPSPAKLSLERDALCMFHGQVSTPGGRSNIFSVLFRVLEGCCVDTRVCGRRLQMQMAGRVPAPRSAHLSLLLARSAATHINVIYSRGTRADNSQDSLWRVAKN